MKPHFVKTQNVTNFIGGTMAVEVSGAGEACLMLADGDAGYGKSRTAQWYAESVTPAGIYVRLKSACTPKWLLHDLVVELGEAAPAQSVQKLYDQAVVALCANPRPIVIDELEHALSDIRVLETIRDISDACEVTTILMGRDYVKEKLRRHTAVWTRIATVIEFGPTSLEDTTALFNQTCEVEVAPEVIRLVHVESEGRIREIVKAIANVERLGRRLKEPVTLTHVAGQTLCQEHVKASRATFGRKKVA
jgi:DNA transposition AAA+ family ATPase